MKQLEAAKQMNAVVSEEQKENANVKEALEEQLSQHREQHQKQVAQLRNEITGKQGALEELRDANQSLTLASEALQRDHDKLKEEEQEKSRRLKEMITLNQRLSEEKEALRMELEVIS